MCCRIEVKPFDRDLAEMLLRIGMFSLTSDGITWVRDVPEEETSVKAVLGRGSPNIFSIGLYPAISHYDHHAMKRIAGGIYFEIAAKYAEKVNGAVIQKQPVKGCEKSGLDTTDTGILIARYPDYPLIFQNICQGFKDILMLEGYV